MRHLWIEVEIPKKNFWFSLSAQGTPVKCISLHGTQVNHSCSGRGWGNILSVTATAKLCQAYTPYSEPNRPHAPNYEWIMGSNFPTFYPDPKMPRHRDLNSCPVLKFILCPAQNQITLRFSLKKRPVLPYIWILCYDFAWYLKVSYNWRWDWSAC